MSCDMQLLTDSLICNLLMGFTDIHMHVKCISQQCVVTQKGKH